MRILFNLMGCGLGNNGGSSTLVKSANTLQEIGNEVYLIDSGSNQYNWSKINVPHLVIHNYNKIPDADVIIATGFKTVKSTIELPERCGTKFHWIRGWETWNMTEDCIINNVIKIPTIKLVNSVCLQLKLKEYNINSYIVMPGYDFDEIYPLNTRQTNNNLILGGLLSVGKHIEGKRTVWLFEAQKILKEKYPFIQLWCLTNEKKYTHESISSYCRNPTILEKNKFYNKCDIWLAPTQREGLHMPPAEAMLTGCPVVGTDTKLSGMQDYLIHNITGLISKNKFEDWVKNIEILIKDPQLRRVYDANAIHIIKQIGSRKTNMEKMVNLLMYLKENSNVIS